MPLVLLIDDRERAIFPHLAIEAQTISYRIDHLAVGDYAVVQMRTVDAPLDTGKVLVIFERKTLEDYAASFKDGRYANKEKLIKLRDATGCRIMYIIEGPPHPNPKSTFGNISYHVIESSIFHLMYRDNINIMETLNTQHTVIKLTWFIHSLENLLEETPQKIEGGADAKLLKAKTQTSELDTLRQMWACFNHITTTSADTFIGKFPLSAIIRKQIPEKDIRELKMSTGHKVNKKIISSLVDINRRTEERLLECLPGISKTTASTILDHARLPQLLTYPAEAISIIKIGKAKKNLGIEKANTIKRFFDLEMKDFVDPPGAARDDKQQPAEAKNATVEKLRMDTPPVLPQLTKEEADQVDDFLNTL